ncbi:MAG: hypothetical protein JWR23_2613 [Mucilaginibacter sp.]|nr:hypothetical protein [Mucilaginibacter sp.]
MTLQLGHLNVFGQIHKTLNDSLIKKVILYGKSLSSSILFTHFDKVVYVNNEDVWFTAYLLNANKKVNNPTILSVILINDHDRSIVLEHRFLMTNGLSFGHVIIPDSVPPGDFSFLIYTNEILNGRPHDIFTQPITIKATSQPSLLANLRLLDTSANLLTPYRKVQFKASTNDGKPLSDASINYSITNHGHSVYSGKVKTNKNGEYLFSIPADQIAKEESILEVNVKYRKEFRNIELLFPASFGKINLKFYPEGGSLVYSTPSKVGWEAKNAGGKPIKVTAVIYENKRPIDTISTDSFGMGEFKLIPLFGNTYKVSLLGYSSDSVYLLPPILLKGPVISVNNAVANDTLQARIVSKYPGKFFVLIHNYKAVFFSFPVQVGAAGKRVLINLSEVPKGLNAITILDSLARPLSERLFFAHYDRRIPLTISTDKSVYGSREKVNLRLKINSLSTIPIKGIVSIACVQSNRKQIRKANDIESYVYLKHELETIPIKDKYMGRTMEDKAYLESVLLIKGWRRFTWAAMLGTTAQDTLEHCNLIGFKGEIKENNKLLKRPINIMVKTDSLTNIITTDKTGSFVLENNNLITAENVKIHLILNDNNSNYKISIDKSFDELDRLLINQFNPSNYSDDISNKESSNTLIVGALEHTINLKNVVIKGQRDQFISVAPPLGTNQCGDYVCRFNVLNCPFHPHETTNHPPIVGKGYLQYSNGDNTSFTRYISTRYVQGIGVDSIIYLGCGTPKVYPSRLTLNGVWYSKEFYKEDYSKADPSQIAYQSTIFWKHSCNINSTAEINLSFYTNDIKGPFDIIVEGVANNDVIYTDYEFNVK